MNTNYLCSIILVFASSEAVRCAHDSAQVLSKLERQLNLLTRMKRILQSKILQLSTQLTIPVIYEWAKKMSNMRKIASKI